MQTSMFERSNNVEKAIKRLKTFEPLEGYFLAFSGGKDSIVIKQLAIEAGVKFDAHYSLTTVDPPELVQFIKKHHADVHISMPEKSMWEWIVIKRMPPTRLVRYCCDKLKEGGGKGRFVVTGVRWAESSKRANNRGIVETNFGYAQRKISMKLNNDNEKTRMMVENCIMKSKHVLNPIIDWSDEEVWDYIKSRNLPYCLLYDEGFTRLGCIGCPMAGHLGMKKEFERWPKYKAAYVRAFDRMVKKRIKDGLKTQWNNGEEVMIWWLSDTRIEKPIDGQIEMDDYEEVIP